MAVWFNRQPLTPLSRRRVRGQKQTEAKFSRNHPRGTDRSQGDRGGSSNRLYVRSRWLPAALGDGPETRRQDQPQRQEGAEGLSGDGYRGREGREALRPALPRWPKAAVRPRLCLRGRDDADPRGRMIMETTRRPLTRRQKAAIWAGHQIRWAEYARRMINRGIEPMPFERYLCERQRRRRRRQ